MAVTSNVTYSGLNNQNIQRLKDIQRAESAVSSYHNSLGGVMERTSHWHVDGNGNVSHYAHVRREDKLNEKLREKEGIRYEKTIPDSVSAGLEFIQGMEKQISGTKFFVGTVRYGRNFGNSSDINFVVNPKFLSKLGTDNAEKIRQEKLEERERIEQELKEHFGDRFKGFRMKWLEEDAKTEGTTEAEDKKSTSEEENITASGKVGVNVGKTARKIAAAKTKAQLRAVIAEIRNDMQVVKDGMEKGWCDETEMDKVNSLMEMSQSRMGEVEDREATPEEESMFSMASLM